MKVVKRNGSTVDFDPSKILKRIQQQAFGLKVDADQIAVETMQGMYSGISTIELDELAAKIAHSYTFSHPDYSYLASRLIVSRLLKETPKTFKEYTTLNHNLNNKIYELVNQYDDRIENMIDRSRDFNFDYFGISQLMKSYLQKDENGRVIETPQYMYMRVALFLANNIDEVELFYNNLSTQKISAATPILFNAGTRNPNMISCNLTYLKGDSLEDILDTMKDVSIASSDAAGIGLCVDNIRSRKSKIRTTGGNAHGVLGVAKIVNELMNVYNQGGKRPGSCALYLSVWHKDIFDFLELKLPTGDEKLRARDLFLALNVPNNFMKAVEEDGEYHLFCPKTLSNHNIDFINTHNDQFEENYRRAVELGLGEKVMARDIYKAIIKSQIETGVPYIHFIDHTNYDSNHSVYGKIKQSNLCIEIMQYSDESTTAQCCLGSIPVQKHLYTAASKPEYNSVEDLVNWESLESSVTTLVYLLNRVIDNNVWSTEAARKGGLEQRAIAIGIQGLADMFAMLDISFDSSEAKLISMRIAETIRNTTYRTSKSIAEQENLTYLRFEDAKYGKLANSLLVAYMPTAGTAQIIGSSESFEPLQTNMFIRELDGGKEYYIINKNLVADLEKIGLWNEDIKDEILRNSGSIQNIDFNIDPSDELTQKRLKHIKNKYKTIWEISQRVLIDLAANRQRFIDQSQSLNLYLEEPNIGKVGSMLMYAWKSGLKTGCYYLRSKAKNKANINLGVKRITTVKAKPNDSLFNCEGCSG